MPSGYVPIDYFCIERSGGGGGGGLAPRFSNIDYLRTGNQQQRSVGSGYWLLQY